MNEPPAEPQLDAESVAGMRKGVQEFNAGRFFECHDTLEEVWQGVRGPARAFFQGIIQVSVGFYHLQNGNLTGAGSQLEKALRNLSAYGDRYAGLELADLRRDVLPWLDRIRQGSSLGGTVDDLPKIRLVS